MASPMTPSAALKGRVLSFLPPLNLSRISMTSRSAVFLPMPGILLRRRTSAALMARWKALISMCPMMATAVLGPMPEMVMRVSKRSLSSLWRKA